MTVVPNPGERIIDQIRRHEEQARILGRLHTVALQRAEIIGITELGAQLLENRKIALAAGHAELARQVRAQIRLHRIVVEERIVAIEQEHRVGRHV
jgi:hypothetical protein